MSIYYVYILLCADSSYYTGVTNNLERRIFEHNEGMIPKCYTHGRRPVKLIFSEEFFDINQAIAFEKQLKGWSRKKKEAITQGDFKKLIELSRSHASTGSA